MDVLFLSSKPTKLCSLNHYFLEAEKINFKHALQLYVDCHKYIIYSSFKQQMMIQSALEAGTFTIQ